MHFFFPFFFFRRKFFFFFFLLYEIFLFFLKKKKIGPFTLKIHNHIFQIHRKDYNNKTPHFVEINKKKNVDGR